MTATTTTLVLSFEHEKDTKNAVRFHEVTPATEDPKVGTLYVKKPALARMGNPDKLDVTISPAAA